ncbi:unnamed protein product [Prorocentrum cordatum]|uniref:Uncharacterized protein n=1 Tax=Prorocentrum cordatum TaxID=2364126 RepID=A0ABN9WUX2_9DINO|nr:unnamed protein product [Polarella glacialis]
MLRDDPIVLRYPEYLPTEEEVELAVGLLQRPGHAELWEALRESVSIGGSPTADLLRFCWQEAVELVRRCVETRRTLGMDSLLATSCPLAPEFRELYLATVPTSFHGADRLGHPLYILRYGSVDMLAFQRLWQEGELARQRCGLAENAAVLAYLRGVEYMTKVLMPEQARLVGRPVDRTGTGRHRPRRHRHAAPRPSPEKLPRRGVQARLDPRPGDRFLHRGGERSVDPLQSRVAAGETVRAPGDAGQGLRLLLRGRGCQ